MKNILARISNFPKDYLKEIEGIYAKCQSVNNILQWFNSLNILSISVASGKGSYRQVENLIFELKVINFIKSINPECLITYEPRGKDKKGKSCDLLIEAQKKYLIELKSFHPSRKCAPIPYDHITENNELIMDGYCYHDLQAVRGHLLDETLDTEKKIKNYEGKYINVMGLLLGYYLHLEDLRDFVTIYRKGHYRFDDPLGKMTLHNLKGNFKGFIDEFWCFPFIQVGFELQKGKKAVSVSLIQGNDREIEI
ncbi:MAG: hypothetical protein KJ935_06720 [Candidatus Omnitrophica bacterium]|nr:hypothetical protein [Candidatus Omnitrophota bacterium]